MYKSSSRNRQRGQLKGTARPGRQLSLVSGEPSRFPLPGRREPRGKSSDAVTVKASPETAVEEQQPIFKNLKNPSYWKLERGTLSWLKDKPGWHPQQEIVFATGIGEDHLSIILQNLLYSGKITIRQQGRLVRYRAVGK